MQRVARLDQNQKHASPFNEALLQGRPSAGAVKASGCSLGLDSPWRRILATGASARQRYAGTVNRPSSRACRSSVPATGCNRDALIRCVIVCGHPIRTRYESARQRLRPDDQRAAAEAQAQTLLIEKLELTINRLRHERFGQSSERGALLDQLELQLADLEENAAQAETTAKMAAAGKIAVPSFERRKPACLPLPGHLPRERIVYPVPATCPCCGDSRLRKLREDVTETLELVPRQ